MEYPNGVKELKVFNNYMSIGVDALVALNFHTKRNESPKLFTSRLVNKMWYVWYGSKTLVDNILPINKLLEVEVGSVMALLAHHLQVDGITLKIPDNVTSIILLNLNSYAGGAKLWPPVLSAKDKAKNFTESSPSDATIEIVGVKDTLEMVLIWCFVADFCTGSCYARSDKTQATWSRAWSETDSESNTGSNANGRRTLDARGVCDESEYVPACPYVMLCEVRLYLKERWSFYFLFGAL